MGGIIVIQGYFDKILVVTDPIVTVYELKMRTNQGGTLEQSVDAF